MPQPVHHEASSSRTCCCEPVLAPAAPIGLFSMTRKRTPGITPVVASGSAESASGLRTQGPIGLVVGSPSPIVVASVEHSGCPNPLSLTPLTPMS